MLAAEHAEALTEVLVRDLELCELEIEEFWSFVQRQRVLPDGAVELVYAPA